MTTTTKPQVFENTDTNGFENALQESLQLLEEQGLGDVNDPNHPPVFILMATNGKVIDDSFGVDTRVYIGHTSDQFVTDLQRNLNK